MIVRAFLDAKCGLPGQPQAPDESEESAQPDEDAVQDATPSRAGLSGVIGSTPFDMG